MKKLATTLLSLIMVAICATARPYVIDVKEFNELRVIDGINVIHKCLPDSAGLVIFDCNNNLASQIIVSNNKNQLKIEIADDGIPDDSLPTIHVYSSFLSLAENSGDSTLTVIAPTPASEFKARIIGNGTLIAKDIHATKVEGKITTGHGHLVLTGKAQNVYFSNTGTGRIEAANLTAEVGKCAILGTGPVDTTITSELTVVGMGSGRVYVKGKPKIKNRTLGIKIEHVE